MTAPGVKHDTISRPVDVASLDASGADYVVEPTEAERAAVAKRLNIPAIKSLRGEFQLRPAHGGVDVRLKIDAEAERICIASLEPVRETIREEIRMQFDRNYVEGESADLADGDLLREPLAGDELDLGELLVQHLSLSLDPYPRKEGAESLAAKFREASSASPFSALKGLVGRDP